MTRLRLPRLRFHALFRWMLQRLRSPRLFAGLLVVAGLLGHADGQWRIPLLDRLEAIAFDARLHLSLPGGVDDRIVIVDIDEKSLAEEGRWPWRRDRVARLVETLFDEYGVEVIGFDVVFAERDEGGGLEHLRELAQERPTLAPVVEEIAPLLDYDAQFAAMLAGRPVVLGYYFTWGEGESEAQTSGMLPEANFALTDFGPLYNLFVQANGYGANLPQLAASARSGHFNPIHDIDGAHRRIPLLMQYGEELYESLSLAVLQEYLGSALRVGVEENPSTGYAAIEWLALGQRRIPVDRHLAAIVPFRGGQGSFPYVSASDVLAGRVALDELLGAIVLVGSSAPGLSDLRSTPMGPVYPGVEMHANLIAGVLDGRVLERPAYAQTVELMFLLVGGLALALLLPLLGALSSTLVSLGLAGGMVAGNLWFWNHGLLFPLASPLVLMLLVYLVNVAWGFFVEGRTKRVMTEMFGQYVPPELVEELARQPERIDTEGVNRELSVLFSDVRDFTSLSEGLPPAELSRLMNAYLSAMTEVIQAQHGTIDKYIGDAIMAFWGAPLDDPEHASHALAAALQMEKRLESLNEEFVARGWPRLKIGIGINSGVVTVGNMGSHFRRAYTVMGDAVNFASRLEGITKPYGCPLLVGERTRALAPGFVYREIDRVQVKGKQVPATIFQPLGAIDAAAQSNAAQSNAAQSNTAQNDAARSALCAQAADFEAALAHYRAQRWDAAEAILQALLAAEPEARLYALYLERIQRFRETPPAADWDGVFTFTTK